MTAYLVTGATGVVGSAVVAELLRQPVSQVCVVVRARTPDELRRRVSALHRFWRTDPAARARVRAYRGDVVRPHLGLAPDEHGELRRTCTHLVHCAGDVRMNLPLAEARAQSVAAMRNVVALAEDWRAHGSLRKVELVSTVGVGGREVRRLGERFVPDVRQFHNTYEAAKAEAELVAQRAMQRGLPATIHRPSMVVGESSTGRVLRRQVFDHVCGFLSGRFTLGVLPPLSGKRLDIVPCDHVARAIVWSSGQQATIGKILHLCSGSERAPAVALIRDLVRSGFRELGCPLPRRRTVPVGLYRRAVRIAVRTLPRATTGRFRSLDMLLDYLATEQSFLDTRTRPLLASAGIELPDGYVERVVRHCVERQLASEAPPCGA